MTPSVLHEGRSLTGVTVDISDEKGRPATRATVSLVADEALRPVERAPRRVPKLRPYEEGTQWREAPTNPIPIVTTLRPRVVASDEGVVATALLVPWDDVEESSAESSCLAADICVGPPVAAGVAGEHVQHPNPDLSLRFGAPVRSREVTGVGRLQRIAGGIAAVEIEVWSAGDLCAIGVCCSLLLPA